MSADISPTSPSSAESVLSVADVVSALTGWLSERLDVDDVKLNPDKPLTSFGLDSIKAVELGTLLRENYGVELSVEQLFDGLTIAQLAATINNGSAPAAKQSVDAERAQTATPEPARVADPVAPATGSPQFSLFFFASDAKRADADRYDLVLRSAKYADQHGFTAVWTPERHFHAFGGLFPNPSVLAAALAVSTKQLRIRAGSVVLPLHDPVRVAEEWAVVDNLSGGRVDIAFATGWNADDFVLALDNYAQRERVLLDGVETVRRLWRGEPVMRVNGKGEPIDVSTLPRPMQAELPTWVTCSGGIERFRQAGALGANVITALLFQDADELAEKITAYREARAANGHDPATGHVTLMLHTYLDRDEAAVRARVERPFKRYLAESVDLWRRESVVLDELGPAERETALSFAFERYYRTSALFGTPDSVVPAVERLVEAGVDEIACLIDFGLDDDTVVRGIEPLAELRARFAGDRQSIIEQSVPEESFAALAAPQRSLDEAVQGRHALAYRNSGGVFAKVRQFDLPSRLRSAELLPFYTELTRNEGATCIYQGRQLIMLGSNNYLGLTADDRVRKAVAAVALSDGPSLTGSRLLNGSTSAHTEFEARLAAFLGRPDALLFTTGYQANIGLLSAVMGEGTVLVTDDECHASIYDGALVGRCSVVQFRHNDVDDLRRRLAELSGAPAMVMVDGVYSMSGDVAPLAEIHAACQEAGVPLAVDDAHGLGMVGATGQGIEQMLGVPGCADVLVGTFSKSLASVGGWVAGERDVLEWIRYHGRSNVFSAAIPPTAVAAAATALDVLIQEPWRIERIRENADYWRAALRSVGFNVGQSRTAIVPVIVGDEMACLQLSKALLDGGLYANCIVAPAVPANKALIRTSVMATHKKRHLDAALEIFSNAGKALGLIP